MSIADKRRITDMDVWDQDAFDLLGPAFFSFDSGFKAIRAEDDPKTARAPSKAGGKAARGMR